MLYLIIATRNKNSSLLIILWSSVGQNNSTSNKTKQNSIPPQSSPPTYTYIVYHHSFSLFRYPLFCCQYPVKFFLFSKSSVLYPHISKSSNTSSLVPFFQFTLFQIVYLSSFHLQKWKKFTFLSEEYTIVIKLYHLFINYTSIAPQFISYFRYCKHYCNKLWVDLVYDFTFTSFGQNAASGLLSQ